MEWTDEAIVLSSRRHGERALIVSLMTRMRGRHAGLLRGAAGGKTGRTAPQTGDLIDAHWRARLPEHLGTLTCELRRSFAAPVLADPLRLAALAAACAMADAALPEREPHPRLHEGLLAVLQALQVPEAGLWPQAYVQWELALLRDLGYGLDLTCCAATGANDSLIYVSPKSGRAVSAAAGAPYRDRLLALPAFLVDPAPTGPPSMSEIHEALTLTGYFLKTRPFGLLERDLPDARDRFVDRVQRARQDGIGVSSRGGSGGL